jgi:hypothetical protein
MVNEGKYFDELQKILGETRSPDEINERWDEVLNRLDELSIEYAKELRADTRIKYLKFGREREDIWQFPPYRLLAMNLILSRWVGWHSITKGLYHVSDWTRIQQAYDKSKSDYVLKEIANPNESIQNKDPNAKTLTTF